VPADMECGGRSALISAPRARASEYESGGVSRTHTAVLPSERPARSGDQASSLLDQA
jgi:hypothetical protein